MSKKPKRTLAEIRAEKAELSSAIDCKAKAIRDFAKVTPHQFLQKASYHQVLDYKDVAMKCVDYYVSTKGSTNMLKAKLAVVNDLHDKISIYF